MDKKGIYIAGSDVNAGKTTFSLGLISWLEEHHKGGASFMKPLGQKTTLFDGKSVGEDTFLVNTSLGLNIPQKYTAPFAMSSGVSERYLAEGQPSDIEKRIRKDRRINKLLKKDDKIYVKDKLSRCLIDKILGSLPKTFAISQKNANKIVIKHTLDDECSIFLEKLMYNKKTIRGIKI